MGLCDFNISYDNKLSERISKKAKMKNILLVLKYKEYNILCKCEKNILKHIIQIDLI